MNPPRNLEIEIKLQLESFTDYLKLVGSLSPIQDEDHHFNVFFDSADRKLSQSGAALRLRAEGKRGLVTFKSSISQKGSAVIRREIEAEINRASAIEIMTGRSDVLSLDEEPVRVVREEFEGVSLVKLVEFHNDRQSKVFRIGDYDYTLEIDKTEFGDGSVDYELEVELQHEGQLEVVEDKLRRMFEKLDIPYQRQKQSKLERALERTPQPG
ncbi:MAG: CYTH domain-containing protein [Deltaproteobacteria bacterium]|nr:CYTH domain-containing protein [Deltaproteobacteria bacterium]